MLDETKRRDEGETTATPTERTERRPWLIPPGLVVIAVLLVAAAIWLLGRASVTIGPWAAQPDATQSGEGQGADSEPLPDPMVGTWELVGVEGVPDVAVDALRESGNHVLLYVNEDGDADVVALGNTVSCSWGRDDDGPYLNLVQTPIPGVALGGRWSVTVDEGSLVATSDTRRLRFAPDGAAPEPDVVGDAQQVIGDVMRRVEDAMPKQGELADNRPQEGPAGEAGSEEMGEGE